jgi:hypothetical protein
MAKKLKVSKKTVTKLNHEEIGNIEGGKIFLPKTLPLLSLDCLRTMICIQTNDCATTAPDMTLL